LRPEFAAALLIAGPVTNTIVAPSNKNGISPANAAFEVRSKTIAPRMLPTALVASTRTSVGRGTSISERNEPVDENEPSHIATLFVAFAATGGTPVARIAGNEMKLPPPAPALMPLATKAAAVMKRSAERFSYEPASDANVA
jgi:hypothetical protein